MSDRPELVLPQGWQWSTLGELCYPPQYGWTTKAAQDGAVKFLRTTDITRGPLNWKTVPYCADPPPDISKYELSAGDIVISRAGSVGFSALIREAPATAVFASYLIRFRPLDRGIAPYLALYLQSPEYWRAIGAEAVGIALANVNAKKLSAISVPVPPLDEQRRIVTCVDGLLAYVDDGHRLLQDALAACPAHRASLREFGCEGRFTEHEMASMTPGSTLAPGWTWRRLEELAAEEPRSFTDGPFGSNLKSAHYTEHGPRVIRLQNVGEGDFIDVKTHISQEHFESLRAHDAKAGDVVIGALGDKLPRACVVPEGVGPAIVKADCPRLRPAPDVNPHYVVAALNAPVVRRQASEKAHGLGRQRLNLGELRTLELPTPSREEQDAIVNALQRQLRAVDEMELNLHARLGDAALLRASVLHHALTGRLVDPDPDEGYAHDLLPRIAADRAEREAANSKRKRSAVRS